MLKIKMSTNGGPVFTFSLPGGRLAPLPPVNYATGHSVICLKNASQSVVPVNYATGHSVICLKNASQSVVILEWKTGGGTAEPRKKVGGPTNVFPAWWFFVVMKI